MDLAKFVPAGRNEVIVRVYSYEDKCPRGTLSKSQSDRPQSFSSMAQLLLAQEAMMDENNSPQRGEEPRSFQAQELQPLPAEQAGEGKPLATFRLSVMFRQNASWQGKLAWIDRKMDAQFRSVLELIRLMDSALTAGPEEDGMNPECDL